jgi:Bcr/CflA subfamily drug resistance transporter
MRKTNIALPIALIYCMTILPQISENIYTPSLTELSDYFLTEYSQIETTVSLYFSGFAAGVLSFGILSDKIGRRPSILYGLALYIAGSLCCLFAQNIDLFFAGRIIQGLGASAGSVVIQTILRDRYESRERGELFTKIIVFLYLAPAVGPLIGGLLTTYFSWHANFIALVSFALFLLSWAYKDLPETVHLRHKTTTSRVSLLSVLKNIITNKKTFLSIIIVGTINGLLFGFYAEGPFIYIDMLGNSPDEYGLLGLIFATCGIIGGIFSKKFLDIPQNAIIQNTALALLLVSILLLTIMGYTKFDLVTSAVCILIMMGSLFFIFSIIIPRVLSNALTEFNYALGTASAFFGCLYYIVVFAQIEILSFIHNGHIWTFPLFFATLSAIIFLSCHLMPEHKE